MAKFIARAAPDGQVYISSATAGKIPDDLYRALVAAPFDGQYDPEHPRELCLTKVAGTEAVGWLEKRGHAVDRKIGERQAPTTERRTSSRRFSLPCCKICGQPIESAAMRNWPEGGPCPNREKKRDPATGRQVPQFEPHTLTLVYGDEHETPSTPESRAAQLLPDQDDEG